MRAITLLGLRDLVPLAHGAFREGRIPDEWTDRDQFDNDIAEAERTPDDIERLRQNHLGYIEDVLTSLDGFGGSDEEFDKEPLWTDFYSADEPVRNPLRHVGHNDPCPCGSGKKFKKCCLASGGPPA